MDSVTQITNLLHRYAELIDGGALEGAAGLFASARFVLRGGKVLEGSEPVLALWRSSIRIHDDGTPRTNHVITTPSVEVDEAAGRATCRSYYTVFQSTSTLPLQPIAAGRYHAEFVRADGVWRFDPRDYSLFDHAGDLSQHLLIDPTRS